MVFDARFGRLFVLGGVTSLSSEPPTTPPKCDFYAYSRDQGWTHLSSDTSVRAFPLKMNSRHSYPLQAEVNFTVNLICVFSYLKFIRMALKP